MKENRINNELCTIAEKEILNPETQFARLFFQSHHIKIENNKHKLVRIKETYTGYTLYYEVEDENYYFCIGIDKNINKITCIHIDNKNTCYLSIRGYKIFERITRFAIPPILERIEKDENNDREIKIYPEINNCYTLDEILKWFTDFLFQDLDWFREVIDDDEEFPEIIVDRYQHITNCEPIKISCNIAGKLSKLFTDVVINVHHCGDSIES